LVTFIACEIVTGSGLTKILGSHPAGFNPRHRRRGGPDLNHAALRDRFEDPDVSFARPDFPTNMARGPARRRRAP
jgi:hypothetical protein